MITGDSETVSRLMEEFPQELRGMVKFHFGLKKMEPDSACSDGGHKEVKTLVASLALGMVIAALPASAFDAEFGLIGVTTFQTARLNGYCDGSVTPIPCDVTFEFDDASGHTLKQVSMILQPNTSAFVDYTPGALAAFDRVEINPCFKILRGTAQPSVELFDNFLHRTSILITWSDGARPRSGDVDFGAFGMTQFDTARLGAYCESGLPTGQMPGAGSPGPTPCTVKFEFHDASGGTLQSSTMTIQPGASSFADFKLSPGGTVGGRVTIDPCFTVATGEAVLDLQTIDSFTGLTLTHAFPAELASPSGQ